LGGDPLLEALREASGKDCHHHVKSLTEWISNKLMERGPYMISTFETLAGKLKL
jgi:hypothetical protein